MRLRKLLFVTGMLVAIFLIATLIGLFQLERNIERGVILAFQRQLEYEQLSNTMVAASNYLTDEARYYVQTGNKQHYDNYWREVRETRRRERVINRLQELDTPQRYMDLLSSAARESNSLAQIEDEAMKALEAGDALRAKNLMFDEAYQKSKNTIGGYTQRFIEETSAMATRQTEAAYSSMKVYLYLAFFEALALATVIIATFWMLHGKVKKLHEVSDLLYELANREGDLTHRLDINTQDEIGEIASNVDAFIGKVRTIVVDIARSAGALASSSEDLSATSAATSSMANKLNASIRNMANAANSQAAETASGAQDVAELGGIIDRDLTLIGELGQDSRNVTDLVQQGTTALDQLNANTARSTELSQKVFEAIQETNDRVAAIAKASKMIRDIARQTNLLALNAAIEAARAGEAGRGFSVVAEEVRKLAEETSTFTDDISNTIDDLLERTRGAVEVMEASREVTSLQNDFVRETNETFGQITRSIDGILGTSQALNDAGAEMNSRKTRIIDVIANLRQVSEENAAITREAMESIRSQTASVGGISDACRDVSSMAESISKTISRFRY